MCFEIGCIFCRRCIRMEYAGLLPSFLIFLFYRNQGISFVGLQSHRKSRYTADKQRGHLTFSSLSVFAELLLGSIALMAARARVPKDLEPTLQRSSAIVRPNPYIWVTMLQCWQKDPLDFVQPNESKKVRTPKIGFGHVRRTVPHFYKGLSSRKRPVYLHLIFYIWRHLHSQYSVFCVSQCS